MSHSTVTMQLNLGSNPAGNWANLAKRTQDATRRPQTVVAAPQSELILRLHVLRGAIEAMRGEVHGPSLAETHSSHGQLGYGSPEAYRSLYFVFNSSADLELS